LGEKEASGASAVVGRRRGGASGDRDRERESARACKRSAPTANRARAQRAYIPHPRSQSQRIPCARRASNTQHQTPKRRAEPCHTLSPLSMQASRGFAPAARRPVARGPAVLAPAQQQQRRGAAGARLVSASAFSMKMVRSDEMGGVDWFSLFLRSSRARSLHLPPRSNPKSPTPTHNRSSRSSWIART
jgi:hypothetical protein